ncbi:hypothetical protein [uncultured Nonlabens sp.]|uniref:hypothetical protein n=1 Tax=uncultured Nonlabens sp. TaxID=859306 RepID=UPI0026280E92|nr:hypothetical protein [uncultured Nonlabens sp.]
MTTIKDAFKYRVTAHYVAIEGISLSLCSVTDGSDRYTDRILIPKKDGVLCKTKQQPDI